MEIWYERLCIYRLHTQNVCSFVFLLVTLTFGLVKNIKVIVRTSTYLVLVLHIFQLLCQIRECWSYIRVILPAFQHYLMPRIEIICPHEE